MVREAGRVTCGALSSQTSNRDRDAAPSAGGDKAEPENHSEQEFFFFFSFLEARKQSQPKTKEGRHREPGGF